MGDTKVDLDLSAPVSILFAGNKREFNSMQSKEAVMMANSSENYGGLNASLQKLDNENYSIGDPVNSALQTFKEPAYYGYYWKWWEPYRDYFYQVYPSYQVRIEENAFERAFKLARKLLEEGVVKDKYNKTVGDFFKLMDILVKELQS